MKPFAVFDIDGTLIRWQLYHAVVDKLAKQGRLSTDSHQKIHLARMRWKNREHDYRFSDYESALINEFEAAVKNLAPIDFNGAVDEVIQEYKDQVYTYTRDLMKTLRQQGYLLFAISGSQQELVAKIAKMYDFDDLVATVYQQKGGRYTGKKTVASHNKKAALEHLVGKHAASYQDSYAIGDSKSDASILEMVEYPIAFNPDAELYRIAQLQQWPIVIERKNMIYKLEYKNGTYVLAQTN